MIIIFILVGATLAVATGDGGLIEAVKESRRDQQIEMLKIKLGIIAQNWSTQRILNDNITLEDLWNDLIEDGIIKGKEDVLGPDENGNYKIVTIPDGIIFDVIIEEDGSVTIEVATDAPRILSVKVEKTTTSITVTPVVSNLKDGTYTYSYKKSTDTEYIKQAANTNTKAGTCTFSNLTEGTVYNIKIEVNNDKGRDERIVNVKLGGLVSGTISVTRTTWANGKATVELTTSEPNVTIQYQIGTLTDNWNDYVASIPDLNHNDIIFVRIYNGSIGSTGDGTIKVTDSNLPLSARIEFNKTQAETDEAITATVTQTDNETGIELSHCKWIYNQTDTKYGEDDSIWTAATAFTDTNPLNLTATTEGTYYLHVLSVDKAGNKRASISESVIVESNIKADGSFSEDKGVNTPNLANTMTPMKWNATTNTWVETKITDTEWYDYTSTEEKWANAKTEDGSMWVWIPRYGYQISSGYHQKGASINSSDRGAEGAGTLNIKFLKGTSNEPADGSSITWTNASGEGNWNVHPAFYWGRTEGDGTETTYPVSGIWVAKYWASQSGDTLKIQNTTKGWTNIGVGKAYEVCLNYNQSLNSHLIKNVEWGAVAYLTQNSYVKYPQGTMKNTTTGNTYGIYNLRGNGYYEYVASYVNNGHANLQNSSSGKALVEGASYTKDVYQSAAANGVSSSQTDYELNKNKYGDAVYEISNRESGAYDSWYADDIFFPYSQWPFITRGTGYNNRNRATIYMVGGTTGTGDSATTFRSVLIPE